MLDEQIQIRTDIPCPPGRGGNKERNSGSFATKYPWERLELGQSFLFPDSHKRGSAYRQAQIASKLYGRKFVVRTTPEGLACWRVE